MGKKLNKLTEQEFIQKINNRECFVASSVDGAFTLKIEKYVPVMSAAIHNGGQFRQELVDNCLLSQIERYYEEDPHTASFIEQQVITLIGNDSRYEYDLNRNTEESVYDTAWGKDIWKTPLSEETIAFSKGKHARFYRIVAAIVEALREDFGECVLYDNHSYNYRRHERRDLPVINIGTTSVKNNKWRPVIDSFTNRMGAMNVPGVEITAAENDIFYGKGYLAQFCHERYDNVLVLATESKKIFMNELTGDVETDILPTYKSEYNKAITEHSKSYISTNH